MLGPGADDASFLVPAAALADRHHRHQLLQAGGTRPSENRDDVAPAVVERDGDARAEVLKRVDYHGKVAAGFEIGSAPPSPPVGTHSTSQGPGAMADVRRLKQVALSLSLSSSGLSSPLLSLDAEEFDKAKVADLIYRKVHQGIVATGRPPVVVDDLFRVPLDGRYSAWRGWRVTRRLTENLLEVTRSGLTVTTTLNRWREVAGDCEHGALIVDSAFPNLTPGWFTIGGATMLRDGGRRWRAYCNVDEACAVRVAMHLKELLDRLDVPFLMKITRAIGAETRSDSLVVEFNEVRLKEVIEHVYQASAGALRLRPSSHVSPFARRVGDGISMARSHSDPSVSFGMWASSVFAESLLDCLTQRGKIEWEQIVILLAERGTDIRRFELST